jgi:hypothetical protein
MVQSPLCGGGTGVPRCVVFVVDDEVEERDVV